MAIFHASTIPLSRRTGRSAVAASAYRSASELYDEREGREHDYTRKRGVLSTEIVLPNGSALDEEQRGALWNAAEAAEKRKDARTAREWVVALPHELSAEQRAQLVRTWAHDIAQRYGVAVDVAIHAPHRAGDRRNWHAHLLATTRTVVRDAEGRLVLGQKASVELGDRERRAAGLGSGAQEVEAARARWAELVNSAMERAGLIERVDHRSLQAQGLDQAATVHLGPMASAMERRGAQSDRGDLNRAISDDNTERTAAVAKVIDLGAERARRELERQRASEAAAAAAAQEREQREQAAREAAAQEASERLERMTSHELAQEIARLSPPLSAFVEKLPKVVAAREQAQALAEVLSQALKDRRQAAREVEAFRHEHPMRTKLYDLGLMHEPYLEKRLKLEASAPKRIKQLKERARTAAAEYEIAQKREMRRIRDVLAPQQEHVARLRELKAEKRAQEHEQEQARAEFERVVARVDEVAMLRQRNVLGYRDQDSRWRDLPERLRTLVDRYIATPKEKRNVLLQELRAPALQRALGLSQGRGHGRGR